MCSSLQLSTGEYRIGQQDKTFIVSNYERAHFHYPGKIRGFRRLERLRIPGVVERLRALTKKETPIHNQPLAFGYIRPQIGRIEGVYEQDTYVSIPASYQLAGVVTGFGLYLVTVGDDFVKSLNEVKSGVASIPFYEQVLNAHPGTPRSPMLLKSSS